MSCEWYTPSTLFNNSGILIGGKPITTAHFGNTGVHYLKDIYDDKGLHPFNEIENLSCSSFFFYLPFSSALGACGVPLQHPDTCV